MTAMVSVRADVDAWFLEPPSDFGRYREVAIHHLCLFTIYNPSKGSSALLVDEHLGIQAWLVTQGITL